jgi:hypothetical protein
MKGPGEVVLTMVLELSDGFGPRDVDTSHKA